VPCRRRRSRPWFQRTGGQGRRNPRQVGQAVFSAASQARTAVRSLVKVLASWMRDLSGTAVPSRLRSSLSTAAVSLGSSRFPTGVSLMIEERRSPGLALRAQYPEASIRSTILLVPPTVMLSSAAMSCTRQAGVREMTFPRNINELLVQTVQRDGELAEWIAHVAPVAGRSPGPPPGRFSFVFCRSIFCRMI